MLSSGTAAEALSYHLYVYRPMPGEPDAEIGLTVRITHKATGESLSKSLGSIKIKALTQSEINAELELMDEVKAHFFDGIKGANKRPDHIISDLRAFREAYRKADGELVWVYDISNETGNGITPTDLPKDGYDESYNLFHSSDTGVVSHENLLVTRAGERRTVIITACLTSERFGRYAELYPDSEIFARLKDQIVSIELTVLAADESDADWRDNYDAALAYIFESTPSPKPGSQYGEWAVLALARSGVNAQAWYLAYKSALDSELSSNVEITVSDATRAVLALTALGLDASDYEGCDLVSRVLIKDNGGYIAAKSGNTALAFALIAIDSKPYGYDADRTALISLLTSNQLESGAWNINDGNPDESIDATAMILTALAPYTDTDAVRSAVDKALGWLASKYSEGFGSSESDAQVLTALSALGIDAESDERFDGLLDSLIGYSRDSGGFVHDKYSTKENELSTEQAAYALAAYSRLLHSQNRLFDMSDAKALVPSAEVSTVIRMIDELEVTDCTIETLRKLEAVETLCSLLSEDDRENVFNLSELGKKRSCFDSLLAEYKKVCVRRLNEAFEALDSGNYTSVLWNELEKAFETGLSEINSSNCSETADRALNSAIASLNVRESERVTVSFALNGDSIHGNEPHATYVVWIPERIYTLPSGSTVYDLFVRAITDCGMEQEGAANGYVASIKAPDEFGGYWLSEFDNGTSSGWVYSVNGVYPEVGLTDFVLSDGDTVVWSYVDSYIDEPGGGSGKSLAEIAEELIDSLGYVTENDAEKTALARRAYDSLTDAEKKSISNYQKLVDAETALDLLSKALPFTDIDGHWAYDAIRYVYAYKLMNGVGGKLFAPGQTLTRAMFVTILYRLDGSEEVPGKVPFADVEPGSWYSDAVEWAFEKGIVNGVSLTEFAPGEDITREQLAVMLMRYSEYRKYSTIISGDIQIFDDAIEVSSWANDSLNWAVGNGIINGRSQTEIAPRGTATRAEAATMILRFIWNCIKNVSVSR